MKNNTDYIEIKCLEMVQPIGKMYIGVIDSVDLQKITYVDIRRLETDGEKRDIEIYSGIQRELSKSRAKQIGQYVNMSDASFPTAVILHIDGENVRYNNSLMTLKIKNVQNAAKVLDGQHRIKGLEYFTGKIFQVNVAIFIDMELEDQAILFATINQTQTKVNKSLVADLFEFASHRSPQKTAHNIVRALNEKEGSPFKNKIKILGTAEDSEKETITQSTFVESIIKYLSKDKAVDRDIYRRGKKPEKFTGVELENRIFRNMFIDEDDGAIAKILWNYFCAVQSRWPSAWDEVTPERILNRSTGFIALMRFLKDAYWFASNREIGVIPTKSDFDKIFNKIKLTDKEFTKDNYVPGTSGQSALYKDLLEQSKLKN